MKLLLALAAITLASCGDATPVESFESAISVTVGQHKARGSYTCQGPGYSVTSTVSTYLYLSQASAPNKWWLYLNNDLNSGTATTINLQQSYVLEAEDNGSAVYNTAAATAYVHRLTPLTGVEYTHDELLPLYEFQVTPAASNYPLGKLQMTMYPKGSSAILAGECPNPVAMTLRIE